MERKVQGILAKFDSPKSLLKAAESVKEKGNLSFDAYSPFPIHGMDDAMGLKESSLSWIVLVGGLSGAFLGFLLQAWVSTTAYPVIVSGKPLFSFQAFIPVTFEITILLAAFSTVFGMLFLTKLPRHYHPFFRAETFSSVTTDGFFIGVDMKDDLDVDQTVLFLENLGASSVEVVYA